MRSVVDKTMDALRRAGREGEVFLSLLPDRARAQARQSDDRTERLGPLDGSTVSWKDMIAIKGVTPRAGSSHWRAEAPAAADAEVVDLVSKAGLVSIGVTNQSELAFSGIGYNPHHGTPLLDGRVPGGSSSGAAASVARGITRLAVGTDTAGSCRVPAAFQGVVGFRPTRGRYPMSGVVPLAPSYDTVGSFARSVADIIELDAVLSGDAASPDSVGRLSVAIDMLDGGGVAAPVSQRCKEAVTALEQAGVLMEHIRQSPLDEALALIRAGGWPGAIEAVETYGHLLETENAHHLDPFVAARLRASACLDPDKIARVKQSARALRETVRASDTIYLLPTVAIEAPHLAPLLEDPETFAAANTAALRLTMPASLLDLPAISLPAGKTDAVAWVGLQLVGPPDSDRTLLATAAMVETLLMQKETLT
ncbi:amidase family protein [Pseudophaeobacter arcticus]|jgi:aspartyl-tRNA(Asn)/glutamyl-tRNA(Gln) amidotransferase subunit A|uniref:amidase family protein n=1 Tax=Pseudophaeobacter arcticus TaxID=385492 RepID=UPI0039E4B2B9